MAFWMFLIIKISRTDYVIYFVYCVLTVRPFSMSMDELYKKLCHRFTWHKIKLLRNLHLILTNASFYSAAHC